MAAHVTEPEDIDPFYLLPTTAGLLRVEWTADVEAAVVAEFGSIAAAAAAMRDGITESVDRPSTAPAAVDRLAAPLGLTAGVHHIDAGEFGSFVMWLAAHLGGMALVTALVADLTEALDRRRELGSKPWREGA